MENNQNNLPLITIITVVYNGEQFLEETILNVLNQDYPKIEYLIIDGGSSDGTLEIIKKFEKRITKVISEKDKGIYDAMNKGLTLASGDWINFMNAGDRYYSQSTLSNIFKTDQFEACDIIVGNTVVEFAGYDLMIKPGDLKDLWKGTQFCHQSTLIKTKLHQRLRYNLGNKITADFEFFFKCFESGCKFQYFDSTIAVYKAGGLSDQKNVRVAYSFFKTVYASQKKIKVVFHYSKHIFLVVMKNLIKSVISPKTLMNIRKFRSR